MEDKNIRLSDEQIKFIEDEFGINKEELLTVTKDTWHGIREKCFDIELDEITDEDCSERGELASDIASIKYSQLFS